MIFAGFIVLQDPVKQVIIETIEALKKLHVNLKIITGDNKNVAKSITLLIGIKNSVVMTGQEFFSVSTEAFKNLVKKTHIFVEGHWFRTNTFYQFRSDVIDYCKLYRYCRFTESLVF